MNLTTFDFQETPVRACIDEAGEPWFVAADVCRVLELENTTRAVEALDEDDLNTAQVIDSLGRKQRANTVSEAGLYQLVFSSRKAEAKAFKRWVTKEVLPAIRKTGGYGVAPSLSTEEEAAITRMIGKLEMAFDDRRSGLLDNGAASVLANLASQYLRAWDVKLRLRPAPPALKEAA